MNETYVHGQSQTRDDLNNYVQATGKIVANLEYNIYKRERKRQAVANLLEKYPEKKFFNETDIQKELSYLEENQIDYEWSHND